jgi:diguanylate cyclase (GGDEF)-like protein
MAAALIVLAIAGPVAAFTRFTIGSLEGDLREQARADRAEVAQLSAHLIELALDGAGRSIALVAARTTLRDALARGDAAAVRTHLVEVRAAGDHSSASLVGANGIVIAREPDAPDVTGIDVSDRDYFQGALGTPQWYVSEAYVARGASRSPLVSVSQAIREGNRLLGVLQVTFTPQQILSATQPLRPGAGRELLVLDARGRVVASTDPAHAPLAALPELAALARATGVQAGAAMVLGGDREYASVPIESGGWSLFVVDRPEIVLGAQRRLSTDIGIGAVAAGLIAVALAVAFALLYRALLVATERVHEQAITDSLTGLYNRRFLDAQLGMLGRAAERDGRPYAVLAMDLDRMKRINDAFGHAAGDQILIEFARTLSSAIRGSDLAVRAGGDEFVVLLPNTALAEAGDVAQRVESSIQRRYANVPKMAVGASIGVAEWRPGRSGDDVLGEADRLLYTAKREGRGLVICEAPPPVRLMEVGSRAS